MTRYFVVAYLDSFFTKSSGDLFGEGEFYFKCNKKRFPDKGIIKLGKNETFDPEPNPVLYSALVDDDEKQIKFDVQVWEQDPGRDDKFIDKDFKLPIKPYNETVELSDKKDKCLLKLVIKIKEVENW